MKTYGITEAQVRLAVSGVENLCVRNLSVKYVRGEPRITFTVTPIRCGVHSRRTAPNRDQACGRRIGAACWHAHGKLFDRMIALAPDVCIVTALGTITKDGGNWQDGYWGRGYNFSDMCDCDGSWPKQANRPGYGTYGFKGARG